METMRSVEQAVAAMVAMRGSVPRSRSALIAVTGIDGSGKGHLTARIVQRLREHRLNAVVINVDGWLNLPQVRFNRQRPAQRIHFALDDPRAAADAILVNDPRLVPHQAERSLELV